jgi:HSP20 family protein
MPNLAIRRPSREGLRGGGSGMPTGFGPTDVLDRVLQEFISAVPGGAPALWVPDVDIEETDDAWVLTAELPGADKADINVDMQDNGEIVISGEIKERERKGVLRRRTRRVGEFEFRAMLPGEVDRENIDASFRDGVLSVTIPKAAQQQPRRIDVHD